LTFVIVLAVLVAAVLLRRQLFGPINRLTLPWRYAWLKAIIIAVVIAVLVVLIPAKVLELDSVAELDSKAQDLIGSGLSFGGLAVVLVGLRLAQKHDRI
jgi:hypothetical protein